jgi:hypothetical protein
MPAGPLRILISAFIIALFVSCEREADNIKYPLFRQKFVISGYLSPDNPRNYISVNTNLKVYGELYKYSPIGNVSATLSDETQVVSLDTAIWGFVNNASDFPIEEGKTYTLKVRSDNGLYSQASCTVPYRRNFALEIDTFRPAYASTEYYYKPFKANIYFTDIPDEENYYMFLCKQVSFNSKSYNPVSTNEISGPEKEYFSDKGIEGKRTSILLSYIQDPKLMDSSFIIIYLLNTDKEYFDFHKSLGNYNSGEDPFTEPSPVYSNITGGLGIFASYTIDSLVFRLK